MTVLKGGLICSMIPSGPEFGEDIEYEDRQRSYTLLLASLPMLDGWKPTAEPQDLDTIAQNRIGAMELGEYEIGHSVEGWIGDPGRKLREYRFRFNNARKALIRDALVSLIDAIDADAPSGPWQGQTLSQGLAWIRKFGTRCGST